MARVCIPSQRSAPAGELNLDVVTTRHFLGPTLHQLNIDRGGAVNMAVHHEAYCHTSRSQDRSISLIRDVLGSVLYARFDLRDELSFDVSHIEARD